MVNNLGVDPEEWFVNPLDSMPIATDPPSWEDTAPSEYEPPGDNKYAPPERRAELESELTPSPEEEDAEWFAPKPENTEETVHEKMYQIATSKYNPFSLGGSDNFQGGSENLGNK